MRKLFCDNPDCGRRIFTERLPGVVAVALGGPLAPGSAGNSLEGDPEVELARAFSAMVRYQQAERLDSWLAAAKDTALIGFADGLVRDLAAIRAALSLPWSTGPGGDCCTIMRLKPLLWSDGIVVLAFT